MKINGRRLMAAREAANVTRAELAVVADLTHVRIWQLETEEVSNINENVGKAIAKRLKIGTDELVA